MLATRFYFLPLLGPHMGVDSWNGAGKKNRKERKKKKNREDDIIDLQGIRMDWNVYGFIFYQTAVPSVIAASSCKQLTVKKAEAPCLTSDPAS